MTSLPGATTPARPSTNWRAAPESPELDFFAWLEDRACFGVQVKGGR